jgi:hypothetical protein
VVESTGVAGSRVVLIDVKAWPEGGRSGPSMERPSMVAVVAVGYPRRCDLRSVIMRGVCGDGWRCMRAAWRLKAVTLLARWQTERE